MAAKSNPFDYYTFYCILMWDASCYCLPAGQKWCLDVSYLLLLRFKSAAELACNLRLPNILLGCNILVEHSGAGLLMGDDIETGRCTGSDYWAALSMLVQRKSKQMAIDKKPKPMSSFIKTPANRWTCVLLIWNLLPWVYFSNIFCALLRKPELETLTHWYNHLWLHFSF